MYTPVKERKCRQNLPGIEIGRAVSASGSPSKDGVQSEAVVSCPLGIHSRHLQNGVVCTEVSQNQGPRPPLGVS